MSTLWREQCITRLWGSTDSYRVLQAEQIASSLQVSRPEERYTLKIGSDDPMVCGCGVAADFWHLLAHTDSLASLQEM